MKSYRLFFTLFSCVFILACEPRYEKSAFSFPVEVRDFPEYTSTLAPDLVSEKDYSSSLFYVVSDTLLFSNAIFRRMNQVYLVADIRTADTLATMVTRGRGPDEVLNPAPYCHVYDGHAHLVDMMTGAYYDLDILRSVSEGRTVFSRVVSLNGGAKSFLSYNEIAMIGKDSLLCFNACLPPRSSSNMSDLIDVPSFDLIDLSRAMKVGNFQCFGKIPLKQKSYMESPVQSFSSIHGCSNMELGKYCFAMVRFPQVNFIDVRTGGIRGIRFRQGPRASGRNPSSCFMSLTSDKGYIYAIYSGAPLMERPTSCSNLLVMDWNGNIQGFYKLDGPYFMCSVSSEGLYMAREDKESKLYYLPLRRFMMQ